MTCPEAAAAVLTEAGQPLHFAEITRRALEKKLLEPKGKPCLRTGFRSPPAIPLARRPLMRPHP